MIENENNQEKEIKKPNRSGFLKGVFTGAVLMGAIIICRNEFIHQANQWKQQLTTDTGSDEEANELNTNRIAQKSAYIQRLIDQYFLFDEDYEEMEESMYAGLMAGLKDPYAAYYSADEMDEVMEDTTGVYYGIGAVVSQNIETGIITITRVYPDSPAEKAGMMAGDMLYKVDGIEATGEELDMLVSQHVRGEQGTSVEIEVYRESTGEYLTLYPVRDKIETETVSYEMLEDDIGYILVSQFENVTDKQFRTAVEELEAEGMQKLVLDLRGNTGGTLDSALGMMSYVLPDGLLFYDEDKNRSGTKYVSENGALYQITYTQDNPEVTKKVFMEDGHQLDMPIVILVNGYTASAAEAFSSSLRDFDWATLLGTKTYGKGIVQTMMTLGDGSMVKLTTSQYYSKSGYVIHQQGLEPDVELEFDIEAFVDNAYSKEADNQIQKAVELLR
ncbi:MAG: S41 family peptidase [bacterium]|nr:S41 family peptidase [bacterium]